MPSPQAPVFILGPHRSGTSAVTGLLQRAGLELGETMAPSPANPKGHFESEPVVKIHNRILSAMDRDWTCPPPTVRVSDSALDDLRSFSENIGPNWGLKDPRSMFLLEPWMQLLEEVRLIGVVRHPLSIARSIERRDGIPLEAATAIARSYTGRLADLHRVLGFPIVDFDAPREATLDRVAEVSLGLGLDWDVGAAREFLSRELIHFAPPETEPGSEHQYLVEAAAETPNAPRAIPAGELAAVLGQLATRSNIELATHHGPQYRVRRQRLWKTLERQEGDLGHVVELVRRGGGARELKFGSADRSLVLYDPIDDLEATLDSLPNANYLIASGLLEITPAKALPTLLHSLARSVEKEILTDGYVVARPSAMQVWTGDLARTRSDAFPIHHTIEELDRAGHGLWRPALTLTDSGRTLVRLQRGAPAFAVNRRLKKVAKRFTPGANRPVH